jgi:hypothetical protein
LRTFVFSRSLAWSLLFRDYLSACGIGPVTGVNQ